MSDRSKFAEASPLVNLAFQRGYNLSDPAIEVRRGRKDSFGDQVFTTEYSDLGIRVFHYMFNNDTGKPHSLFELQRRSDALRNRVFSVVIHRHEGSRIIPPFLRPKTRPELRFVALPFTDREANLVIPVGNRGTTIHLPAKPWLEADLRGPEVVAALSKSISEGGEEQIRWSEHQDLFGAVPWSRSFAHNGWRSLRERVLDRLPPESAAAIAVTFDLVKQTSKYPI